MNFWNPFRNIFLASKIDIFEFFILFLCMCVCMCALMFPGCQAVHICVHLWRTTSNAILRNMTHLLWDGFFLSESINQSRLACQWASVIHVPSPPQCWNYKDMKWYTKTDAEVFLCPPGSCSRSDPIKHTDSYII